MKPWEPGAFIVIEPGPVYAAIAECRAEIEFLHTVNNNLRADLQTQAEEAAKLIEQRNELLDTAKRVVARWDSPLWKDLPHTAEFINGLRAAITKATT